MSIKAIETTYRGYRFRSRTEARWAVFFDTLGVKWDYEVEGFELPDGTRYLPDFRISTLLGSAFFEVKPSEPDANERRKLKGVTTATNRYAVFLIGTPSADAILLEADFHEEIASPDFSETPLMRMLSWIGDFSPKTIRSAINAARSARFEFGESGAA
jgi:hypothetical protein